MISRLLFATFSLLPLLARSASAFSEPFDESCPDGTHISKIIGRFGHSLDAIGFVCSDGSEISFGGAGGSPFEFVNDKGFKEMYTKSMFDRFYRLVPITVEGRKANGTLYQDGDDNKKVELNGGIGGKLGTRVVAFKCEDGGAFTGMKGSWGTVVGDWIRIRTLSMKCETDVKTQSLSTIESDDKKSVLGQQSNSTSNSSSCPLGTATFATHCWYDRGAGTTPGHSSCPEGYTTHALTCSRGAHVFGKDRYNRGAGFMMHKLKQCEQENPDKGCEMWGVRVYPKCAEGYRSILGFDCVRSSCPEGYADHGATCARGVQSFPRKAVCAEDRQFEGGLCYLKPLDGFNCRATACFKGL